MQSWTQFCYFTLILRLNLQILYKYIKNSTAIFKIHNPVSLYPSTADIDTPSFVCSFVPFCLPWQRRYRKPLQQMSDKYSGLGIMWPCAVSSALWFVKFWPHRNLFSHDLTFTKRNTGIQYISMFFATSFMPLFFVHVLCLFSDVRLGPHREPWTCRLN